MIGQDGRGAGQARGVVHGRPGTATTVSDQAPDGPVVIGLSAAIVAVTDDEPRVLVVRDDGPDALPAGPFRPDAHRTLDIGLRAWVTAQTRLPLGYVEQLYTFADRGRDPREWQGGPRIVSIGYLALVREAMPPADTAAAWRCWYDFFPWEDRRAGAAPVVAELIRPRLAAWIAAAAIPERNRRRARVDHAFGPEDDAHWHEDLVLERYELLYEAGLVAEAERDRSLSAAAAAGGGEMTADGDLVPALGRPMRFDHRRILATAIGRIRGKLGYRPLVFEVMPPAFTLTGLQTAVEALAGRRLHKQNFRRLVAQAGLVEATGRMTHETGGRPAELYSFRAEVMQERGGAGLRLPGRRG
ncbi:MULTISPECIES: NUDIX hydrolase [Tistrella]|jgi:hypothetical protein|uniref:NrtR DNA-binding winged helix domain-containing protein n=1 Tax=Tistrella arctica TaxID=3133430 RepID=A0ABU9YHT7_9PROT